MKAKATVQQREEMQRAQGKAALRRITRRISRTNEPSWYREFLVSCWWDVAQGMEDAR